MTRRVMFSERSFARDIFAREVLSRERYPRDDNIARGAKSIAEKNGSRHELHTLVSISRSTSPGHFRPGIISRDTLVMADVTLRACRK